MPQVSIITPVYNAARWLPETLASVRAQTLSDWEHLLVDDGSTDGSQALIEAAATQDKRFRLLRMPRNGGPSAARNLGIQAAGGRFIAFLDADDLWLPEKLKSSIEWMERRKYGFIYHDYRQISADGTLMSALITGPEELTMRTLHTGRGAGCLAIVIDRQQIPDFQFPTAGRLHTHEDFCAWLSLVQRGYVGHRLPADLARYRLVSRGRAANKFREATRTWIVYRDVSKLPLLLRAFWWIQYVCQGLWRYFYARPRKRLDPSTGSGGG
jgi:glycosyltransferase involved in cell wall biosynthesis